MKRNPKFFLIPLFLIGILNLPAQDAAPKPGPISPPAETETEESEYNDSEFGTAVVLSESISTTTGVAISPLLGMGVLGAWQYFRADETMRETLPWYTAPWIWGICFGIFLLLKSKDTVGAWIPELVKKPITVLDDLQEKASALIVGLAVIPTAVLAEFKEMVPETTSDAPVAMAPFIMPVLIVVGSIVIFMIVWVAFHALSSIKILSPSSMINSAISIVKGAFLAAFALLAALNPWVGLALSIGVIVICAFFFGWAFRWNVIGSLFVKDFFTGAFNEPLEDGETLKGFSTNHFPDVKPRTYGEIERVGDELVFSWKPWLIMPKLKSRISLIDVESSVRKGVFLPSVTINSRGVDRHRSVFDFRLRYRSQVDEIQNRLQLDTITPSLVLSGIHASWLWIKDQFQQGGSALSKAIKSDSAFPSTG